MIHFPESGDKPVVQVPSTECRLYRFEQKYGIDYKSVVIEKSPVICDKCYAPSDLSSFLSSGKLKLYTSSSAG